MAERRNKEVEVNPEGILGRPGGFEPKGLGSSGGGGQAPDELIKREREKEDKGKQLRRWD